MPNLNGEFLLVWVLAALRATGLMLMPPVFSARSIPVVVRVVLGLLLAFLVAGVQKMPGTGLSNPGTMIVAMLSEFVLGLLMGWAVRLTAQAIDTAGQIIASELGFTMGQQMDPMTGDSSNAVASLLTAFGTVVFLATGAHQAMLAAYLKSYSIAPLGALQLTAESGTLLVHATGKIFLIAMQMAAPLIAVNFVVTLTFAILGKAAPAIQVFSESFAVRIVAGFSVLALTLRLVAQLAGDRFQEAPELMLRLLR
jgi:flagellar biosynthetic protein FliR